MPPATFHDRTEQRIDTRFRRRVLFFILNDIAILTVLSTLAIFVPLTLIGMIPLVLAYGARMIILIGFSITHYSKPIDVVGMYTTVPSHQKHLRRSANLSQHKTLHSWYVISIILGSAPFHAYFLFVLIMLVLFEAINVLEFVAGLVVLGISYFTSRAGAHRFYNWCVERSVSDELSTPDAEKAYAASRAAEKRDAVLNKVDVYLYSRRAVKSIPSGPESWKATLSARASVLGLEKGLLLRGRSRSGVRGRERDRNDRKNRKRRNDN